MKFKEYAGGYIEVKKSEVRPTSSAKYINDCKKLNRYFGDIELCEISAPIIRGYVKERLDTAAVKTVKCEVTLLKSILNSASEEGLCGACILKVKYPPSKHEYKILEDEEFDRLYEYCKNTRNYATTAVLIAMNTGMRIGEICALKKSDIDFRQNSIKVERTVEVYTDPETHEYHIDVGSTKTAAGTRIVPITEDFSKLLGSRIGQMKDEHYIFSLSKPTDPTSLRRDYKDILDICGIEYLPFHSLRHSFATRMISRGVDPKTAAAFLGHSDCNVTLNIYTNCTEKMKRDALAKIWG